MSEPRFIFTLPPPQPDAPKRRRFNPALWLVGIGLLANAGVLFFRGQAPTITFDRAAFAQAAPGSGGNLLGARGIYMMPAQVTPNSYGVYLMDVDAGTLCVYRVNPDTAKLRLIASRSFKSDRYMEDFNNDAPAPKLVQQLVEEQRKRVGLKEKEDVPTVDQSPKPDENLPDKPKDAPNDPMNPPAGSL